MSRKRTKPLKLKRLQPLEQSQPQTNGVFIKHKLLPRTPNQWTYAESIDDNKLTVCVGPAGTGKTYLAAAKALIAMKERRVDRLIITRPLVQAGENTGFLPGDIEAKLKPYLKPIYDELRYFIDIATIRQWLNEEKIEIVPFAYMRGRNLHNCFIIADEAQNADMSQLKMLVTRFGKQSRMVICGDMTQTDLPGHRTGALNWLIYDIVPRMIKHGSSSKVVTLDNTDIQREKLVEEFVLAIEEFENETQVSKGACT